MYLFGWIHVIAYFVNRLGDAISAKKAWRGGPVQYLYLPALENPEAREKPGRTVNIPTELQINFRYEITSVSFKLPDFQLII